MADKTDPAFTYTDVLPLGDDATPYRCITTEGVRTVSAAGRTFLEVDPEAIRLLTAEAMHDIAHYLQPHPSLSETFGEAVLSLTGRSLNS